MGWLFVGLFLPTFLALGYLTRPIADDYKYMFRSRDFGLLGVVGEHVRVENGRFGSSLIVSIGYHLFGERSVRVLTIGFVLLLVVAMALAAWRFLPFDRQCRLHDAALTGAVGAVATIVLAPSLFDSYFWLTSAVNYAPAFAILLLNAVIVDVFVRGLHDRPWYKNVWLSLFLTLSVFVGQGLNEITAVLVVMAIGLVLIVAAVRRRWLVCAVLGAPGAAALSGLAIMYYTPGAAYRRELLGAGKDWSQGLVGLRTGWNYLIEYVGIGSLLLICLATALLVGLLCGWQNASKRVVIRWSALGALFIISVPSQIWVTGLTGAFAARTMTVPMACLVVGFICFGAGPVAWLFAALHGGVEQVGQIDLTRTRSGVVSTWTVVLGLALVAGGIPAGKDVARLVQAEALRASAVAQRDASVQAQLRSGRTTIEILPAPLLYSPNQGKEFPFFANPDSRVMINGYRHFFRLPGDAELVVLEDQPVTYCVNWPTPEYYRAKSCDELASMAKAD